VVRHRALVIEPIEPLIIAPVPPRNVVPSKAGAEPHGGVGSADPDDFFKISDKLLFIMKPTPTA
jgi:hypothetical protein